MLNFNRSVHFVLVVLCAVLLSPVSIVGSTESSDTSTSFSPPEQSSATMPATEYDLWVGETQLRGANIWQRRVYPEIDVNLLGDGPVGPPYTQEDFDRLASLGANYVQISVPGIFTEEPPYAVDVEMLRHLMDTVEMVGNADMFAVIAYRSGPGRSELTFRDESPIFGSYANNNVWSDEEAQQAWVDMWKFTAIRFRRMSHVVGYQLMVEPNVDDVVLGIGNPRRFDLDYTGSIYDFNQFYPRMVAGIREADPTTPILISGLGYGSVSWLRQLEVIDEPGLVFTFSQYEPYAYTHALPVSDGPNGMTYPGTFDTNLTGNIAYVDVAWLDDLMGQVDQFQQQQGAPAMAVAEFGAMRFQPGAAQFLRDSMNVYEQRQMNHAIWMYHSSYEPFSTEDQFDYLHGTNPNNHTLVLENELTAALREYWGRNVYRPSNVNFE